MAVNVRPAAGRPRAPGACFEEHVPGVACAPCRATRQRRWRKTHSEAGHSRQRTKSEEEALGDRARGYVGAYLRRGAIVPRERCEVCGLSGPLKFWHPSVTKPRELIWLCARDRKRLASTLEPMTLTWVWPGFGLDADVRVVQPDRSPRGALRAERRQSAIVREIEIAEQRAATRGSSAPIDADAMLARLSEAERFVDEVLKRVEARFATFEEWRASGSRSSRERNLDDKDDDDR